MAIETKGGRLEYLDSLRGLTAMSVLFYHVWNRFYPHLTTQARPYHGQGPDTFAFHVSFVLIQYGYLGVTLFFVLSGYCIHMPQARRYWQTGNDQFKLKDFASRRFWRLYPAYFGSLLFSSLALAFFPLINSLLKHIPINWVKMFSLRDVAYNALFLQQLEPSSVDFNGVYWTLLFEVQFYVVYPALLQLTRRLKTIPILLALLVFELYFSVNTAPVPWFVLQRLYEWYLGIVAIELVFSGRAHKAPTAWLLIGSIFLTFGIAATLNAVLYPFRDPLIATSFAGFLLWLVVKIDRTTIGERPWYLRALHWRPIVDVGLFSYSLYLLHVPIIDVSFLGAGLLEDRLRLSMTMSRSLALLCIPTSFLIAAISYRWLELPFMPKKNSVSSQLMIPTEHVAPLLPVKD